MLHFVATFQRAAARIDVACWRRTTASSPRPSPPKEERETARRPVSREARVRSTVPLRVRVTPADLKAVTSCPSAANDSPSPQGRGPG